MSSPIRLIHELENVAYAEDYADLQIALDRLHDQSDPVVSSKEMRNCLC